MEKKENILTASTAFEHKKSIWIIVIEILIIGLIILVSIAFYPWAITVFNPVKEMVAKVFIIMGLMLWGFKLIDKGKIKFISTTLNLPATGFILICVFSLLWSDNIFTSLRELPLFLAGPLLYFLVINNIDSQYKVNRIINLLLIVGTLFGIYGIFQYIGVDFPIWSTATGRKRVLGLFGNVNFFAEYLILPLPIAISLFLVNQNKIRKILLLIATLAMSASLVFTFTRSSYLAFGTSLVFMFSLYTIHWRQNFIKNKKKILIVILLAVTFASILFFLPNPLNKPGTAIDKIKSRVSLTQITEGSSIRRRLATWQFTILMIKDRPVLGSGIGTYKYNTLRYQAEFFSQRNNRSIYPHGFAQEAHNEYLQLWAEMGIIGLGIFLWLIIAYFKYGLKVLKKSEDEYKQGMVIGLMGAVLAVLVDAIFGFPLHLPATVMLFWLAIGLTVVLGLIENGYYANNSLKIVNGSSKIDKNEKSKIEYNKMTDKNSNKIVKIPVLKPVLYICMILLAVFLSIIVVRPFIARTYWFRAEEEKNRGDIDINETVNNYFEALKWDPYLGQVYYDIGEILMNEGYYTPALDYFEKAEKYVSLPSLPLAMARTYINKDMLEEGVVKLRQAISYQSRERSMLPLYAELGDIYLKLGKIEQAGLAYQNALKIDADFVSARYGLARVFLIQKLFDKALIEFQKVIELAPESLEAGYARQVIQQLSENKVIGE